LLVWISPNCTALLTQEFRTLINTARPPAPKPSFQLASTPAEALELLRSEPDYNALILTLRYLVNYPDFSIQLPSPLASQLVQVLLTDIVPSYWNILREGRKLNAPKKGSSKLSELELLLSCLRSVSGINGILLSLKRHIQQSRESKKAVGGPNFEELLTFYLQLLQALLEGSQTVETIWKSIYGSSGSQSKQKTVWNEFLSIVGSGKILGIAAEAEDVINDLSKKVGEKHWVANGSRYSSWLARNLTRWIKDLGTDSDDALKCCGELLSKSCRLGYTGESIFISIVSQGPVAIFELTSLREGC
jgi:telomere length regulation protein